MSGKRSMMSWPEGDHISYVRLICTRDGAHTPRPVGFVSFADDGRGVVVHDRRPGSERRAQSHGVTLPDGRWLLESRCPSCASHYQLTPKRLRKIIDAHGSPGCVVDVDIFGSETTGRAASDLARFRLK